MGPAVRRAWGARAVTILGSGSPPRMESTATRTTWGVSEESTVLPMENASVRAKSHRYGRKKRQMSACFVRFKPFPPFSQRKTPPAQRPEALHSSRKRLPLTQGRSKARTVRSGFSESSHVH